MCNRLLLLLEHIKKMECKEMRKKEQQHTQQPMFVKTLTKWNDLRDKARQTEQTNFEQ